MVVLIALDCQDPASKLSAMNSLCVPGAIGLLGGRSMLCCRTLIRPTTSITNKVAPDHSNSIRIVGGHQPSLMGTRLDDLVALLRDAIVQLLYQVIVGGIDALARCCDSLEDAEHGDSRQARAELWARSDSQNGWQEAGGCGFSCGRCESS